MAAGRETCVGIVQGYELDRTTLKAFDALITPLPQVYQVRA
jgi:hypothetical protein